MSPELELCLEKDAKRRAVRLQRHMEEPEARLVPATAPTGSEAVSPDVVVSPDGRDVAFFRGPPG